MHLVKVKLAGFKSFVDPTTFHFPSKLIGIVGPNGCGKSNIIDAVRWVMGESSAKQLRGDSMADVIFNGSGGRKPVGQATIELIFDNSDGRLGGAYGRFGEIAVKRVLGRDGQSTYYLNGTRCRRRDITDVFLGTGLGPRSYAIIEQGMISRIVDAGPSQLRAFLEEAAGISKYKERRHETELRLRHTAENLSRINDLCDEIGKQLDRLQRQARNAERFKRLKQEERQVKAELLAMRWRREAERAEAAEREIAGGEVELEERSARQRAIERQLIELREASNAAGDRLNEIQQRFYASGAEVTRIEQAIRHQRELRVKRQDESQRLSSSLEEIGAHIQDDQAHVEENEQRLAACEPQIEAARNDERALVERVESAQGELKGWRDELDALTTALAEKQRDAGVERTRIEHGENQTLRLNERLQRVEQESSTMESAESDAGLRNLEARAVTLSDDLEKLDRAVAESRNSLSAARASEQELGDGLHARRDVVRGEQARLASLETLQKAALDPSDEQVAAWLQQHELADAKRIGNALEVEEGWEEAVESVLEVWLDAVCVTSCEPLLREAARLERGSVSAYEIDSKLPPAAAAPQASMVQLAEKIRGRDKFPSLLSGVYAANDLEEALELRSTLTARELVVTRDGTRVGPDWFQVSRGDQVSTGLIKRNREIAELTQRLAAERELLASAESEHAHVRASLTALEKAQDNLQRLRSEKQREVAEIQSQLGAERSRREARRARAESLVRESSELRHQIAKEETDLGAARSRLQQCLDQIQTQQARRAALEQRRPALQSTADELRVRAQEAAQRAHGLSIRAESWRSSLTSLRRGLERQHNQRVELETRLHELEQENEARSSEVDELETARAALLEQRAEIEKRLDDARKATESVDLQIRGAERARHEAEQAVQETRQQQEQRRLRGGEARVRCQGFLDQIKELDQSVEQVLEALPNDAEETHWQERLDTLAQKVQRLGAINLAAIEEFSQESERKSYLEAQQADLRKAVATLEAAIQRIDRETRSRFENTYNAVNRRLGELFTRLFAGGHAFLELTTDDPLEAGVAIMARPPGKRISNIHLLSGGEKALTAIALVFTLFQLNPAPFCMLDEVDAPLDEANVERYSLLVREMSDTVQFVVITHNKGTMESLDQLVGVTMQEPGVSRLVSVDVEEAARLAAV